ncbi:uncharacterized protein LOC129927432 [Biomphalaria glabrata]|uniref:Uncharacterized protein LOC129927432 n=1 Tax=Biomphalaria glabrata TaxID=6526 RepID=A0A9W3AZC1_BIOGL|nr:uncharacterized protein LOC129927432 [Biomphalaria glabrata]
MAQFKVFVYVCFVTVMTVKGQIMCPDCTDPYDPDTCTDVQYCQDTNHDICELHVHLAEFNRVTYFCSTSHQCINRESQACNVSTNEMCTFCCDDLHHCEMQRRNLFSTRFTTPPPTYYTTHHFSNSNTGVLSTQPSVSPSRCIICDTDPCDMSAVPYLDAVQCSHSHPYCSTKIVEDANGRSVHKGCATEDFCRKFWWDLTSQNADCMSTQFQQFQSLDCSFCCQGEGCNRPNRPAHSTLAQM